jgi:hypothetical protein
MVSRGKRHEGQRLDDEIVSELDERHQGRRRELLEPVPHHAGRRHAGEPAEARDERIASDIA